MSAPVVRVWTDGSAGNNGDPGGWGAVVIHHEQVAERFGGVEVATSKRMELLAVVEILERLTEPCIVRVFTDSKDVITPVRRGWLRLWKKKGWRFPKKYVDNADLWRRLHAQMLRHRSVRFMWVKGHNGDKYPYNERAHELANRGRKRMIRRGEVQRELGNPGQPGTLRRKAGRAGREDRHERPASRGLRATG